MSKQFPRLNHQVLLIGAIKTMSLGDPLAVVEWNTEQLNARVIQDSTHTTAAIINHFTVSVGECGHNFTFERLEHYTQCRDALPQWALSVGPVMLG